MDAFPLLDRFPADWAGAERARGAVAATVAGVAGSAAVVSDLARQGPLAGTVAAVVGTNADGDVQKELDVRANRLFVAALRAAPVAVARYHTARPSRGEESPLFGRRGPFLA
jgi:fructose-1,6-bisphosphatase I